MDRTPYQDNIIKHYYKNKDSIMLQKLGELTTELYLAENRRKRDQLWKRVEQVLKNIGVPESKIQSLIAGDRPADLAKFIEGKMF